MESALLVSEIEPGQPSEPATFLRKQKPVTKPRYKVPSLVVLCLLYTYWDINHFASLLLETCRFQDENDYK